jgi:hypothetical protein
MPELRILGDGLRKVRAAVAPPGHPVDGAAVPVDLMEGGRRGGRQPRRQQLVRGRRPQRPGSQIDVTGQHDTRPEDPALL